MIPVSDEYKRQMKFGYADGFRGQSYVWVYLGLVNRDAQGMARISSDLADFSDTDIFGNSQLEAYYATFEENFARTDGSMILMPEDASLYPVAKQGAASKDVLGAITFRFESTVDNIGGLTVDFGGFYPTEFTVTNGHDTYTYENASPGQFVSNDAFTDSDYITITPVSMAGGRQRLRILSILFGVGFVFGNSELISTRRSNRISHLSEELPSRSFDFTISNLDQMWTLDNPGSYAGALREMQVVQVTYGRELDDGTVYKIPSGYMALKTWDSDHEQASFSAVGFLDYSTTTYFRGKCHPDGITLYDLAVDVLEDMGVTSYSLDSYLKRVSTKNPLPIDLHKNCLQMIANAAECVLYEDSEGVITMKASFYAPEYRITATNYEMISNVDALVGNVNVYDLASFEDGYAVTDGRLYFIGEDEGQQQTGLVSYVYPTPDELSVTISFESTWTFTGLTLIFGIIHPESVTILEYNGHVVSKEGAYAISGTKQYINHEFQSVDMIVLTFSGVADNTRIHLNRILVGAITDYTIEEHDIQELPTAVQTERIRNINIKYYQYFEGDSEQNAVVDADVGENLATFDKACFGYSLSYDGGLDGTLEVVESGAYYVVFTSSVAGTVRISAKEYVKAENTFVSELRETGNDLTLENELISDLPRAEKVGAWFSEYYGAEVEYDLNYRGEPALECGDRIFLDSRFVDNNMILVTSEELSTSTGMSFSNPIKARRLSYTERA